MPVEYRIDKVAGIVHARAVGELTDEEALGYQTDLTADADFDPWYQEFFDLSGVKPFRVTPAGLQLWVSRCPWSDEARRVFVAHGDLEFGMLRMYQGLMRGEAVAVFRTESEALQWLDADEAVMRST